MPMLRTIVIIAVALLLVGGLVAIATAGGSDDLAVDDASPAIAVATKLPTPTDDPTPDAPPATTDDPTPDATPAPATAPLATNGARTETFLPAAPRTDTFTVLDVGTVTLEIRDVLVLADVQPQPGWRIETDSAAGEVEVSFRAGEQRVDWKAEFEDGKVRIRVRDRRIEDRRDDG
jgi:hypothetical protein